MCTHIKVYICLFGEYNDMFENNNIMLTDAYVSKENKKEHVSIFAIQHEAQLK